MPPDNDAVNPYAYDPKALEMARARAGYSQEFAASLIGVHQVTISRSERGQTVPSPSELRRLAEIYRVDRQALADNFFIGDLSSQESQVIRLMRNLPSQERGRIVALVRAYAEIVHAED